MPKSLDLETLSRAVSGSGLTLVAASRFNRQEVRDRFSADLRRTVYSTEKRRLPNYKDPVECVLLYSVQSQANRMEEGFSRRGRRRLKMPIVEVDFTPYAQGESRKEECGCWSRWARSARCRRRTGSPTRSSGQSLAQRSLPKIGDRSADRHGQRTRRLRPLEICPTALVFGMWDSTGPKGGLSQFERAMVAEVVGIDAVYGVKTSSRIDPLGICSKPAHSTRARMRSVRLSTSPSRKRRRTSP